MKGKFSFLLLLGFCFVLLSCNIGAAPEENNEPDLDYITVWPDPQEKQINVTEGTKTVALLATGKHCDVYYDKTVSQPTESQLRLIVSNNDNDYERLTSFLGLYERGSGPGGDGGGDNNPRIQVYIYDHYPADIGARALVGNENEESVTFDFSRRADGSGSLFTHELSHLIFYGNNSTSAAAQTWYIEFLPLISEVVFHGIPIDRSKDVQLFGVWEQGTYRRLARFLVDKYGNTILYDLFHEASINRQALINVLSNKGQTLSNLEKEFADWCNNWENFDERRRYIAIDNISLSQAGIWLTSDLPSGNNIPINTAINYGIAFNNRIDLVLNVPIKNTFIGGPIWSGDGDYYVYILPIINDKNNWVYNWRDALVYTDDNGKPSKVTFSSNYNSYKMLSFENFRKR